MHKATLATLSLAFLFVFNAFSFAVTPAKAVKSAKSAANSAKVLNNFVTELVSLKNLRTGQIVNFSNPRQGWIYVAVTPRNAATASFSKPEKLRGKKIALQSNESAAVDESMQYLPAGECRFQLTVPAGATIETLVVRTIPEIFYDGYRRASQLHQCNDAARDWDFLEKHVSPNINTFVVSNAHKKDFQADNKPTQEIFDEWRRRGKHWVVELSLNDKAKTVDEAYQHYLAALVATPGYNGYLIDEFMQVPERREINRINIQALSQIADRPDFAGKKIYPYVGSPSPTSNDYKAVSKFTVDNRTLLALEWYVREKPIMANIWDSFGPSWHAGNMKQWNKLCPGAADSLLMTLAIWNVPDLNGDVDPQLNGKVFFDHEMNFLANHPVYQTLRGINVWNTAYMDEEMIRWMCRLFRHYCIDGNKNTLSADPIALAHLVNPDFEQGADGWELKPAVRDSITPATLKDYGKLQGRYKVPNGDHLLIARRAANAPNRISQTVKNLTPGRLYTFRMYTADHALLKSGRTCRQNHAVSISIAGAKTFPERELHIPYYSMGVRRIPPYNEKLRPCWFNYHWVLFRAESQTARLTVADWPDENHPPKDIGQELVFNFFQVEPYFAP